MRWPRVWLAPALIIIGSLTLSLADARIVVGVSTVNVAFLPIYLTQDKGFFKDEGLDVLVVMFNAGATNLQAARSGRRRRHQKLLGDLQSHALSDLRQS